METEIEGMRGASGSPGDRQSGWATSSEADCLYLQIMISFLLLMYL